MTTTQQTRKSNRGFASMDPEKQRLIARKGGRAFPTQSGVSRKTPNLQPRPDERAARA